MLDYIDAFFSWCDVANPMGIPITCCLNAFIYKNRSIQDKEKFKSLIQAGNGFIAHAGPHIKVAITSVMLSLKIQSNRPKNTLFLKAENRGVVSS
mgnify:CR=1 FL=1